MAFPEKVDYVIVGAGIHGLSTAWHLAAKLKAKGKGDGSKIVVIDKDSIAAGASGIACGVVRNNYYQPAMRELMAMCVEVWESDAKNFHYHDVGYIRLVQSVWRVMWLKFTLNKKILDMTQSLFRERKTLKIT